MWCNDYVEDTISDSVLTSWRPASSCPRLLIQVSVTESVSYCCLSFLFWPLSQGFNFDMTSKKKSEGSMKYTFAGGPWRFPMEKPYFCNETRPVRGRAYVKWAWLLDLTTLYHSSLVLVVGIIDLWQHACTFFFLLGVVSHLKKKKSWSKVKMKTNLWFTVEMEEILPEKQFIFTTALHCNASYNYYDCMYQSQVSSHTLFIYF